MRIYTPGGELPTKVFTFPDGQPHVELLHLDEFRTATIEMAVVSPHDLLCLLLAKDALDASGYITSLDIRYLTGARMDRRINGRQPATLDVVGRLIQGAGFRRVRVLDPHSPVSLVALNAEAVMPLKQVHAVLAHYEPERAVVVAPDAGATLRVDALLTTLGLHETFRVVQGLKHRDSSTGRLSGFSVVDASAVEGKTCVIVDDLCDGGGTFSGLAEKLTAGGAKAVDLYVTHGVFSKGLPLPGIRTVFTTDSYPRPDMGAITFPVDMSQIDS